jgi:hypothetical protein
VHGTLIAAISKPHDIGGLLDDLALVHPFTLGGISGEFLLTVSTRRNLGESGGTHLVTITHAVLQILRKLPVLANVLLVLAAFETEDKLHKGADFGLELAAPSMLVSCQQELMRKDRS